MLLLTEAEGRTGKFLFWLQIINARSARHERELNIFQSGSITLSQKASYHVTTAGAFSLITQLVSRRAAWDFPSLFTPTHTIFKQGFLLNVFQSQVT